MGLLWPWKRKRKRCQPFGQLRLFSSWGLTHKKKTASSCRSRPNAATKRVNNETNQRMQMVCGGAELSGCKITSRIRSLAPLPARPSRLVGFIIDDANESLSRLSARLFSAIMPFVNIDFDHESTAHNPISYQPWLAGSLKPCGAMAKFYRFVIIPEDSDASFERPKDHKKQHPTG